MNISTYIYIHFFSFSFFSFLLFILSQSTWFHEKHRESNGRTEQHSVRQVWSMSNGSCKERRDHDETASAVFDHRDDDRRHLGVPVEQFLHMCRHHATGATRVCSNVEKGKHRSSYFPYISISWNAQAETKIFAVQGGTNSRWYYGSNANCIVLSFVFCFCFAFIYM